MNHEENQKSRRDALRLRSGQAGAAKSENVKTRTLQNSKSAAPEKAKRSARKDWTPTRLHEPRRKSKEPAGRRRYEKRASATRLRKESGAKSLCRTYGAWKQPPKARRTATAYQRLRRLETTTE